MAAVRSWQEIGVRLVTASGLEILRRVRDLQFGNRLGSPYMQSLASDLRLIAEYVEESDEPR